MGNVAEVDLFGRTFQLTKTLEPYRTKEDVFYRWSCVEAGVQLALLRSVNSGAWEAFLQFSEETPCERHFAFWGFPGKAPEDAVRSLQDSIVSGAILLSNILRGNELV